MLPKCFLKVSVATLLLAVSPVKASINVAVTLSDLAPIVRAIGGQSIQLDVLMPAGTDPHGFALSAAHIQAVQRAEIVVTGGDHHRLHFEEDLLAVIGDKRTVGWQDYSKNGARLLDVPGFPRNPHGFWMDHVNAQAIAKSIAEAFIEAGIDSTEITARLALFIVELAAASEASRKMAREAGVLGDTVVVAIPGVAYIATNAGLNVASILLKEGAGFIGGSELVQVSNLLQSGRAAGIVCPLSMRDAKPGTVSEQLSRDTGARVIYVHFVSDWSESFLAQTYYNAAALTAGTARGIQSYDQSRNGYSLAVVTVSAVVGATIGVLLLIMLRRRGDKA
jgi:zinc/manganese transport system substrate-binding protein